MKGQVANTTADTSAGPASLADTASDAPGGGVSGPTDVWRLVQRGFHPDHAEREETLFSLANGTLGVRGGCEEAGGSGGCFLAEVHERSPIHYHERFSGFAENTDTRVPVADGSGIAIRLGDYALDPRAAGCLGFERVLDLRAGCLRRRSRWSCPQGGEVELVAERVVPFGSGALLALRLSLRSIDYRGPVRFESILRGDRAAPAQGDDPRIGAGAGTRMRVLDTGAHDGVAWMLQGTQRSGLSVECRQGHRFTAPSANATRSDRSGDAPGQEFQAELAPGQTIELEKFVVYAWGHADPDGEADLARGLRDAAGNRLAEAVASGYQALASEQAQAMAEFWDGAAMEVRGDPATEQGLRFNLFHLLQSTGRGGATSTAAKGLTGDGYEGHYFWDTEVYMLPVLALTAPELARGMLEYRHRTLDAARRHAREMNHDRGALYAWRTIGGDECSAYYPSGSAQYHINAAIAYAIRVYVAATDDVDFLAGAGAEMLFEMARIWMQIGHFNPRRGGAFCIHGVTGPDEYSALVDNNFYTNTMARAHLLDAVAVWHRLAGERPQAHAGVARGLGLELAEVALWQKAAEAMYLPYDQALGIHAQDDGFLDRPVWDFEATPADRYPLLLHYHPLTIYRHQVCKQADVVLALVLEGGDVDAGIKRRCFDYYQRVTVHDSTLSAAPFGVLACELGLPEQAWRYFDETLRVDLDDLHDNTSHGAHMAAMAGSWLGFAFGFAGLRIVGNRLHFAPSLPGHWRGYRLDIQWRGRRLSIDIGADGTRYTLVDGAALSIVERGLTIALCPGESIVRALPETARWPLLRPDKPLEAVIFDLDGVLTDTANVHYHAWKRLADELGIDFDREVNRRLKGVDRMASLEIILERAGRTFDEAEKAALAERKNRHYRTEIEAFTPDDLLPGALAALNAVKAAGLGIGLASASRNAPALLERLGIADRFDFIADPAQVARGKPDPEIFLAAARGLGVEPAACLGVEDAAAGIAAIKAAGMSALGIGDRAELAAADAVLAGLIDFRIETVLRPCG